jgi:hypothetical protein
MGDKGSMQRFWNCEPALETVDGLNNAMLTILEMEKDERLTHAQRRHYNFVVTELSKQIRKVIFDERPENAMKDVSDIPF